VAFESAGAPSRMAGYVLDLDSERWDLRFPLLFSSFSKLSFFAEWSRSR
jgi:hypothetical protein